MEFNNSQPIYQQIIDDFRKQIVRGELREGDKIPSQREYAERVRVNPNTVQRAYREMENLQMVKTLRGQGTFISASEAIQVEMKNEMAREVLARFIGEMQSLGYDEVQIISELTDAMQSVGGGRS